MGRIRRWLRGTLRADRFEGGEVDAGSVNAEEASIGQVIGKLGWDSTTNQDIPSDTETVVRWETLEEEDSAVVDVDVDNDKMTILKSGTYLISAFVTWRSTGLSQGDEFRVYPTINDSIVNLSSLISSGEQEAAKSYPTILKLSANDEIDIRVRKLSEGSGALAQGSSIADVFGDFTIARLG